MAVTIGSNISSLRTIRQLDGTTRNLASTSERLASGQRINRASDDAAGLAIVSSLNASTRVYTQGVRNLNDGLSALSIASDAISGLSDIVTRQRELAEQAANGVYSSKQREALNNEANALVDEFNRVVASTSFNGIKLLDNSFNNVRVQIGFGTTESLVIGSGQGFTRTIGNGTFESVVSDSLSVTPWTIRLADLNHDGAADLINASDEVSANATSISVSISNGDGTFQAETTYATGGLGVYSGKMADVNNDGNTDIVSFGGSSWFSAFLGRGDGTFQAARNKVAFNSWVGTIGDFDNDGKADVVTAVYSGSTNASFFRGYGDGTFADPILTDMGGYTQGYTGDSLNSADLNGDGKLDLIRNGPEAAIHIHFGNGDGTFKVGNDYSATGVALNTASVLGDLNGDGAIDIVSTGGGGAALLNRGDGTFYASTTFTIPGAGSVPLLSDLNGDAKIDLIFGGSSFAVKLGNGDGTFASAYSYAGGANGTAYIAVGDINGDGANDVVSGGVTSVAINLGKTVTTTTMASLNLRTRTYALAALDTTQGLLTNLSKELGTLERVMHFNALTKVWVYLSEPRCVLS